jgi:hypothetical protein
MFEHRHALADGVDHVLWNLGLNQFFAISGSGGDDDAVRIDDHGGAAECDAIIGPDPISDDEIALVFNGTRQRQNP